MGSVADRDALTSCERSSVRVIKGLSIETMSSTALRWAAVSRWVVPGSESTAVTCHLCSRKRSSMKGLEVSTALDDSTVLLYSLLAVCMVLLLSSLSLALAVFLRGARAKTTKQGPKAANHSQERVIQPGQEVGLLSGQLERSSKDFVTNSSRPTDRDPLEDSSPTETCVCVHCFPDLTALGQGNDRPLRAPYSFNQQAVPLQAQIQNGRPSCTGESLRTTGLKAQAEAAVG
eukprot:superscaffoldBa00002704_g15053